MRFEWYVRLAALAAFLPAVGVAQPASRPGNTNTAVLLPPPTAKSPVEFFRELLAMTTPSERYAALSNRSPENQKLIMSKVREYLALSAEDRELRLRATELHWRMLPLMRVPATNRAERLAAIPEPDRRMIESRLEDWDKLPGPVQQQLLTNQEAIRLFIQREAGTNAPVDVVNLSPKRRQRLEEDFAKFNAMKTEERRQLIDRFTQFFELTPEEKNKAKQKALSAFTAAEKARIEKTLTRFQNLTSEQRTRCIQSFEKFSTISLAERQQFLKNAERWIAMKEEDRKAWRDLVEQIELMPPDPRDPLQRIRPPGVRSNNVVKVGATN